MHTVDHEILNPKSETLVMNETNLEKFCKTNSLKYELVVLEDLDNFKGTYAFIHTGDKKNQFNGGNINHWMFIYGKHIFDSYGLAEEFLLPAWAKKVQLKPARIQEFGSNVCGEYCCTFYQFVVSGVDQNDENMGLEYCDSMGFSQDRGSNDRLVQEKFLDLGGEWTDSEDSDSDSELSGTVQGSGLFDFVASAVQDMGAALKKKFLSNEMTKEEQDKSLKVIESALARAPHHNIASDFYRNQLNAMKQKLIGYVPPGPPTSGLTNNMSIPSDKPGNATLTADAHQVESKPAALAQEEIADTTDKATILSGQSPAVNSTAPHTIPPFVPGKPILTDPTSAQPLGIPASKIPDPTDAVNATSSALSTSMNDANSTAISIANPIQTPPGTIPNPEDPEYAMIPAVEKPGSLSIVNPDYTQGNIITPTSKKDEASVPPNTVSQVPGHDYHLGLDTGAIPMKMPTTLGTSYESPMVPADMQLLYPTIPKQALVPILPHPVRKLLDEESVVGGGVGGKRINYDGSIGVVAKRLRGAIDAQRQVESFVPIHNGAITRRSSAMPFQQPPISILSAVPQVLVVDPGLLKANRL
jgi:hypothetical protein